MQANRWTPFVETIDFVGLDLTGATMKMQVRDRKDGGFVRADLTTVPSNGTEGVSLVSVVTTAGVPTSRLSIRINEPTMEAMSAATEPGEDAQIWWDIHITPAGGVKFVALEGPFIIMAGSTQ